MKFKIGDTLLDNNVFLAPMAGVTDLPFRLLCREQGAGMSVTEMVSAKAILYKNKNTKELLAVDPAEGPVSVQLFGSDPEIMAAIAAQIEDGPYVAIDVNMGCPVPKIVNNHEGSALMKDPAQAEKVLTAMVKAVKKPVTVKFRKGFNFPCRYLAWRPVALYLLGSLQWYCNCSFRYLCTFVCKNGRKLRRSSCGSPWPHQGTVLFRKGRLGYYPPGKRGGKDTGDRKRRCIYT